MDIACFVLGQDTLLSKCFSLSVNLMLGGDLRWTSIPSGGGGGSRNTPSRFMLRKPE